MHSSFIAATLLYSALDFFIAANALALPLRRATTQSRQSTTSGTQALAGLQDGSEYVTNITIDGQPFSVIIDTGSSDLWVQTARPVTGAFDSTDSTEIDYVSASVKGEDKFATVTVGGFNITNQIYMEVPPQAADGLLGIMGLGPSNLSAIFEISHEDTRASSSLVSLFAQNAAAEPFFTYQLGRLTELPDASPGTITFAEVILELSNITSQPKLPVVVAPADGQFRSWSVVIDGMTVNGQNVTLPPSTVDPTKPNQFVTILDTGTTAAVVPEEIFDAIYGNLTGAVRNEDGTVSFPCDSEVNVTFTFGGQEFPVHPLDIFFADTEGHGMCEPQFEAGNGDEEQDALLGDAFLRSVYALHHFGDTIRGGPNQPYIQLLSTLDVAKAHAQFVQVRVDGANSTSTAPDPTASATGATTTATGSLIFPDGTATGTSVAASVTDSSSGAAATGSSDSSVAVTGSGAATATDSLDADATATGSDSSDPTPTPTGSSVIDSTATGSTDVTATGTDATATGTDSATDASATDSPSDVSATADATASDSSTIASPTDSLSTAATDSATTPANGSTTDSTDASVTATDSADAAATGVAGTRRAWRSRR